MKITKEEFRELNENKKVEIWCKYKGAGCFELIEVVD